jgi:hypothetical protein
VAASLHVIPFPRGDPAALYDHRSRPKREFDAVTREGVPVFDTSDVVLRNRDPGRPRGRCQDERWTLDRPHPSALDRHHPSANEGWLSLEPTFDDPFDIEDYPRGGRRPTKMGRLVECPMVGRRERYASAAPGIVRELLRGSSVACDPVEAEQVLAWARAHPGLGRGPGAAVRARPERLIRASPRPIRRAQWRFDGRNR